jgi:uracil-DNA glycosylase family 4
VTDRIGELEAAYAEYVTVEPLQRLAQGKRMVSPAGPVDAPLVLVGEAPGADEEHQGQPFVGRTGQLLQDLFRKGQIPWQLCYRTNVVAWRPDGNRTPYPYEILASRPRLMREIAIIRPAVVLAVGATAWRAVTDSGLGSFGDNRGKITTWKHPDLSDPITLMAIYHPGAIIRMSGGERRAAEGETVAALQHLITG